jgi:hypothetical protein
MRCLIQGVAVVQSHGKDSGGSTAATDHRNGSGHHQTGIAQNPARQMKARYFPWSQQGAHLRHFMPPKNESPIRFKEYANQ